MHVVEDLDARVRGMSGGGWLSYPPGMVHAASREAHAGLPLTLPP